MTVGEWTARRSQALLGEVDELTARIVGGIRSELPGYEKIPIENHRAAVREQIRHVLLGLHHGRPPDPAGLAIAERLGRERAHAGVPVSAVMEAYIVASRELWTRFATGLDEDPYAMRALLDVVPEILLWGHRLGGAAADGYQMATADILADDTRLCGEFCAAIQSDPSSARSADLARELGLDPDGEFQAVAFVSHGGEHTIARLRVRLRPIGVAGSDGSVCFVLFQRRGARKSAEGLARRFARDGVLGIGRSRQGLNGARLSVEDAERALGLATAVGHDVEFERHWLLATIVADTERRDDLSSGIEAATENPHVADTVLAFAEAGFSAAGAARAQHLHANSAAYRLERWEHLTGWHLKDFEGLARSIVAIRMARATTASEGGAAPAVKDGPGDP
ncbi:helix-turn-helix domain-containing protein [Actinoallomurus bryophytorum]|uniref:PucR-like helix-turn-helix protein n=1 Tax=Actinoallomurus bryophytorum TaxID=1490222 RepID=A0A543CIN1_9ACTN|nr:helix-turn-helix domain-containing protein [Actinoallomurus bryophytorum]TQL96951.1 PucR-like helix-turn-helix protein [Actinoallomurus bryophytorum]